MACRTCAPSSQAICAGSSITAFRRSPSRPWPPARPKAMKFTYTWLKEHLDTKAGVEKIADTLTRIGLEVEKVFDPKTSLAPFRVAEVVKCEKHPNADKLSICEVATARGGWHGGGAG